MGMLGACTKQPNAIAIYRDDARMPWVPSLLGALARVEFRRLLRTRSQDEKLK